MTKRNIWLIDDDKNKYSLLELIINMLNNDSDLKKNGIVFADGFDGSGLESSKDARKILKALDDPNGIYLLDLDMPSEDYMTTNDKIRSDFNDNKIENLTEIITIRKKLLNIIADEAKSHTITNATALSSTLLAFCIVKNKNAIICSAKGGNVRNIATILNKTDYSIPNFAWPDFIHEKLEKNEIFFKDLKEIIKKMVLNSIYIDWQEFIHKVINFKLSANGCHYECENAYLLLKNFLRLEDNVFKKYFASDIPGKLSSFTATALKSIAGSRNNVELHAGWLLALGVFRGLPKFFDIDWETIWRPENFINIPNTNLVDQDETIPLIEMQSEEIKIVTLKKFCIMCENFFKHQHNHSCSLNSVSISKEKMVFSLNFPFENLKLTLAKIINLILHPSSNSQIEKHLTSTSIRDFWISMSISDESNPDGFFPNKAGINLKSSNDGKCTEVIFGIQK